MDKKTKQLQDTIKNKLEHEIKEQLTNAKNKLSEKIAEMKSSKRYLEFIENKKTIAKLQQKESKAIKKGNCVRKIKEELKEYKKYLKSSRDEYKRWHMNKVTLAKLEYESVRYDEAILQLQYFASFSRERFAMLMKRIERPRPDNEFEGLSSIHKEECEETDRILSTYQPRHIKQKFRSILLYLLKEIEEDLAYFHKPRLIQILDEEAIKEHNFYCIKYNQKLDDCFIFLTSCNYPGKEMIIKYICLLYTLLSYSDRYRYLIKKIIYLRNIDLIPILKDLDIEYKEIFLDILDESSKCNDRDLGKYLADFRKEFTPGERKAWIDEYVAICFFEHIDDDNNKRLIHKDLDEDTTKTTGYRPISLGELKRRRALIDQIKDKWLENKKKRSNT